MRSVCKISQTACFGKFGPGNDDRGGDGESMNGLEKVNFLLPVEDIEASAMDQIRGVAALDFVERMAIMPDVHTGYDMPIGGVALTSGVISPAWVGYDIGCGVLFQDTGIPFDRFNEAIPDRQKLVDRLYQAVPVGTNRFVERPAGTFYSALGNKDLDKEVQANEHVQLGTLGSGNHFLEIGVTQARTIGITIHSGSRNLGHRICTHYLKRGKWFDVSSDLGLAYQQDMDFALNWALSNRLAMLNATLSALAVMGLEELKYGGWLRRINVNHNHADQQGRFVIHRKGATPALLDQEGVIPGNMRDGVYIVRGLGNVDYLSSCSHGAGRAMGRNEAKRRLTLDGFRQAMDKAGVVAKVSESTLDESPDAYKDIAEVIARQEGRVIEVVDFVRPIINIKG